MFIYVICEKIGIPNINMITTMKNRITQFQEAQRVSIFTWPRIFLTWVVPGFWCVCLFVKVCVCDVQSFWAVTSFPFYSYFSKLLKLSIFGSPTTQAFPFQYLPHFSSSKYPYCLWEVGSNLSRDCSLSDELSFSFKTVSPIFKYFSIYSLKFTLRYLGILYIETTFPCSIFSLLIITTSLFSRSLYKTDRSKSLPPFKMNIFWFSPLIFLFFFC